MYLYFIISWVLPNEHVIKCLPNIVGHWTIHIFGLQYKGQATWKNSLLAPPLSSTSIGEIVQVDRTFDIM